MLRSAQLALVLAAAAALACGVATAEAPVATPVATTAAPAQAPAATTAAPAKASAAKASKPAKSSKASSKRRRSQRDRSAEAHIASPSDADDTPAVRYARLSQDECEAELASRGIEFTREEHVGVLAPVRVTRPLHGVTFRTNGKDQDRADSPYEVTDCRLVLALDDFAEILVGHDIVEVRHYSIYRPPHGWAEDRIGGQHNGALAIDAGRFIASDGKVLDVDHDFHGRIGAKTCGDGAGPRPSTPDAVELRAILCEAAERHLFNVMLTPNFNRPHHNHFHLEVMAGVRWFLLH